MYICTAHSADVWVQLDERLPHGICTLLNCWFPGGTRKRNGEYLVANHLRGEKKAGSFSVRWKPPRLGMWYDHAIGEGGDIVSLGQYLLGSHVSRTEVAKRILEIIGG